MSKQLSKLQKDILAAAVDNSGRLPISRKRRFCWEYGQVRVPVVCQIQLESYLAHYLHN